jgi:hypothetical protein
VKAQDKSPTTSAVGAKFERYQCAAILPQPPTRGKHRSPYFQPLERVGDHGKEAIANPGDVVVHKC